MRRAGETVFNNLSWALLTWSQSTSGVNICLCLQNAREKLTIHFQVHTSLSGHGPSFNGMASNDAATLWRSWRPSRSLSNLEMRFWDTHGPPLQVVDPRYSKGCIPNRMGPNDQEALLLNETEYSKGLIATRQNQKPHRDLSMTRITIHQNPTVWHKFAQPTHLAPKKNCFFGPSNNCIFPGFWSQEVTTYCGEVSKFGAIAAIVSAPFPKKSRSEWYRAKRCRKRCTGCIRLLNSPTFHLPHKFSYISYINLGGAYDAPPILSNSGKWRVNGISYLKCNNPGGHCYILYATLQCHLTSRDSAPPKKTVQVRNEPGTVPRCGWCSYSIHRTS